MRGAVATSIIGLSTLAFGQCTPEWALAVEDARYGHIAAYDSARDRVVIHGGFAGGLGDTWEWDGTAWQPLGLNGPSVRSYHSAAADSARGVITLFGGSQSGTRFNDTWEWDGTSWLQHTPAVSPPPLDRAAMTYDSARGVIVLHGGVNNIAAASNQTWEWDGINWTLRSTSFSVSGHCMAYDPDRGRVVLFGGITSALYSNQTWEWDGNDWTLITSSGPSPRAQGAMAWDPTSHRVILYGGGNASTLFDDVWAYDGVSWSLLGTGPGTRYGHTLTHDPSRGVMVMRGGVNYGTQLRDTWEWDGSSWVDRTPPTPGHRIAHAMAFDGSRVISFGGTVTPGSFGSGVLNDETWVLDGATWTQAPVSGPAAHAYVAMAFDTTRNVVVLYNNTDHTTWEWDSANWTQVGSLGPSGLDRGVMAYDSARARTVLVSYRPAAGNAAEVWEWDGTTWSQVSIGGGPTSVNVECAMTYDAARGICVLQNTNGIAWAWDGTSWSFLSANGPSPRFSADLVYDEDRQICVFYAGQGSGPTSFAGQTWEWNGSFWQPSYVGPPSFALYGSAWDSANRRVVLYGGYDTTGSSRSLRTWEYRGAPSFVRQPASAPLLPGSSIKFVVGVRAAGNISYEWYKDDVLIEDGATGTGSEISGAHRAVLYVSNLSSADAGTYRCIASNACGSASSIYALLTTPPCAADFNADGSVDFFDYLDFVAAFSSTDPTADINADTVIDFFDYLDFVAAFSNGCP